MRTERKHIVFIDDSAEEIRTFERLYSGERFRVTAVQAQRPSDSLAQVAERLAGETPNLFVLDLFFPEADEAPSGLSGRALESTGAQIRRITKAASQLPRYFSDSDRLLKEAHGLVVESQQLLSQLCQELRQSPNGGIKLLEGLNRGYPGVPKVFYSRKATIDDVKKAMMEGALDVLSKPHPSTENREASSRMDDFGRYCSGQPSSWITLWMEKAGPWVRDFAAKFLAELTAKKLGP
jgi:CheY-like chemotaxis protein